MSLGKNLNIGSKKADDKSISTDENMDTKEVVKSEGEDVAKGSAAEDSKMQLINETAAAVQKIDQTGLGTALANDADLIREKENMIIVFPVGDEEYAISIDDVKEVVPLPPIASIPQVPAYILGVANVRGNVLAVLDLAEKFSHVKQEGEVVLGNFVLVVKSEEHSVAINVRDVPNTMTVSDAIIDSPGNIINHTALSMNHIKGIVKKDKRMIIWVDIQEIITQIELDEMN